MKSIALGLALAFASSTVSAFPYQTHRLEVITDNGVRIFYGEVLSNAGAGVSSFLLFQSYITVAHSWPVPFSDLNYSPKNLIDVDVVDHIGPIYVGRDCSMVFSAFLNNKFFYRVNCS